MVLRGHNLSLAYISFLIIRAGGENCRSPSLGDLAQVCDQLQIKPLHTSPYHPETDGMLERRHASFKAMIRKSGIEQNEWDVHLNYLPVAYWSLPHSLLVLPLSVDIWTGC